MKILEGWRAEPRKSIGPENLLFPVLDKSLSSIQVWSQTPDIVTNTNGVPYNNSIEIKLLPVFQSNREYSLGESHDKNFLTVSPKIQDPSRTPSPDPINNSVTLTYPKSHLIKVKIYSLKKFQSRFKKSARVIISKFKQKKHLKGRGSVISGGVSQKETSDFVTTNDGLNTLQDDQASLITPERSRNDQGWQSPVFIKSQRSIEQPIKTQACKSVALKKKGSIKKSTGPELDMGPVRDENGVCKKVWHKKLRRQVTSQRGDGLDGGIAAGISTKSVPRSISTGSGRQSKKNIRKSKKKIKQSEKH